MFSSKQCWPTFELRAGIVLRVSSLILLAPTILLLGCVAESPSRNRAGESSGSEVMQTAEQALKESEELLDRLAGREISEAVNEMDGIKTYSLMVLADKEDSQSLIVRCSPSKSVVDVIIHIREFPRLEEDRASVRIKFDDTPPIHQLWQRSTNYHGLFSPDPGKLLRHAARAKKFLFEYPTDDGPLILTFDLAGMHEGFPKLDAACGISKAAEAAARAATRAAAAEEGHARVLEDANSRLSVEQEIKACNSFQSPENRKRCLNELNKRR